MRWGRYCAQIAGVVVVFLAGGPTRGEPSQELSRLKGDLLKGDWQAVMKDCEACDPATLRTSPVLQAIMGHACLALNRNNESLQCFTVVGLSRADAQAWLKWASEFSDTQRNATALYLKGDALARNRRWAEAKAAFTEALEFEENRFLALNARGVVRHALGDTRGARSDFKQAAEINKEFGDAYASRGTLNVQEGAAQGAKEAFEQARERSRQSWVVLNGLGCVACGEQLFDEADRYFAAVSEGSPLWPLARRNAYATAVGRLARTLKRAREAGMSITDLILKNSNGASPILSGRDPDDKPVHKVPDGRGGYYIIDDEGIIVEHVPAPGTGPGQANRQGTPEREPDDKPIHKIPDGEGGWYIIDDEGNIIEHIPPPRPDPGEDGEKKGTTLPRVDFGPQGIMVVPQLPAPSLMFPPLPQLEPIVAAARQIQAQLPQVAVVPVGVGRPAGADSGSVQAIRANRGLRLTQSVYGLLYRLPQNPKGSGTAGSGAAKPDGSGAEVDGGQK